VAWISRVLPGDRGVLRLIARADTRGNPSGPLTVASLLAMGQGNVYRVCDLVLDGWCELFDHASERDTLGLPARVVRLTEEGREALMATPV